MTKQLARFGSINAVAVNSERKLEWWRASDKVQEHRKTDKIDKETNPTGDSRFDLYLPISGPPATELIEFMIPITERFSAQFAKGKKGQ